MRHVRALCLLLPALLLFLSAQSAEAQPLLPPGDVPFATFDDGDFSSVFAFSETSQGVFIFPTDDASGTPDRALGMGIAPAQTGAFAGFAIPNAPGGVDVSGTQFFTFQIRTQVAESNLPIVLELNLHEDVNGDGFTPDDDEYQALYTVTGSSPYTLVSIPLDAFTDDNSVFPGSDDGFDFTALHEVVVAWPGVTGPDYTLSFDEIVFRELPNVDINVLSFTSPQRGASVSIDALLSNNETIPVRTRVYFTVDYPNGASRRYSILSKDVPAEFSDEIQLYKPIAFPLPTNAPAGTYTVRLYAAGDIASGGAVYDSDSFTFVLPPLAPCASGCAMNPTSGDASLAAGPPEAAPNPFSDATTIRYALDDAAEVDLRVFDVTGREVARLASGAKAPGTHAAVFEAGDLPSGVYVWRLATDGAVTTGRITLAR